MKINIHSIHPTLLLEIEGTESWLKNIYATYQTGTEPSQLLKGKLRLHEEEAGTYLVTGSVSFVAKLPCDLCELSLAWPVEIPVNVRYLPEITNTIEREKNLSRSDLDAYYIEEEHIDLEALLNDSINDALPTRSVKLSQDGSSCLQCGKDVSNDQVWSSRDEKDSPFAALKSLKLRN